MTEQEKWERDIKKARNLIKKSSFSKDIRFLMALRNEIQCILNEYHKKTDKL